MYLVTIFAKIVFMKDSRNCIWVNALQGYYN